MIKIEELSVTYLQDEKPVTAVREFSLQVSTGQTYGLVGESGSGKTTVAMAIMRYLGRGGRVARGRIEFDSHDLLAMSPDEISRIWGKEISLVPQDPLSSLNPSIRIGEQIAEGIRQHLGLSPKEAALRAIDLLMMVRVPDAARIAQSFPHQISGGMQQRVLIAMAMSTEPKLLVLDEPTTSLDVTTQAAILDLLRDLILDRQTAVLYITHNLGVVARICDRVAVLYAGELVEDAPTDSLYRQPLHPYTQGLLDSVPRLGQNKADVQLHGIPGRIPSLSERGEGCVFAPRCPLAIDRCHIERPPLDILSDDRRVRCHRWPEIAAGEISARMTPEPKVSDPGNQSGETVLELQDVKVEFPLGRSLTEVLSRRPQRSIKAVDGIDLFVRRGETLGLVGESGSGKTTLARSILGLVERTSGNFELLGVSLPAKLTQRNLETMRQLQYIFQNPEEALNPYLSVGESLERPFITLMGLSRPEAHEGALKLLEAVRLPANYIDRMPGQLSGGEKQRIAIARAFATAPDMLLADEPVSSLDVSVQASVLTLIADLQARNDSTLLFITHDLAVVSYLADQIAVIYAGQLMEVAGVTDLFKPPYHPYTEALLSAVPLIDPTAIQKIIRLEGDVPSQIITPTGCRFHPRCPRYLGEICRDQIPPWQETESGDRIFCHIPLVELKAVQKDIIELGEGERSG